MSGQIQPGSYRAKAKDWGFGKTARGDYQIGILFDLLDAPGHSLNYYGVFSERAVEHTLKAMRACGWRGENLADLTGMGEAEVSLVVEHEEYNGRIQVKVKWVNPPGGALGLKERVEGQELLEFARSMVNVVRQVSPAQRGPAQQQANRAAQTADRVMNGGAGGGANYGTPPGGYGEPDGNDDIPF